MIQAMIHNTHRRAFLKTGLALPFAFGKLLAAQNDADAKKSPKFSPHNRHKKSLSKIPKGSFGLL